MSKSGSRSKRSGQKQHPRQAQQTTRVHKALRDKLYTFSPSQLTTLATSAVASGTEDVQLPGQASPSGALQERTHQQSSNNLHQKYMRGGVPAIGKDVQTSSMDSSLLGKEKHKKGLWKLTGKA